ncbi:hypothetical protein [Edaphobacter aggregans]|uniref:hypothetical protein n=1 Tax=Edaphobacter aggregans TaxID=570835 RepID=UPI000F744EBA|nr:hypothetical protein [Edaphobacter aggregans]
MHKRLLIVHYSENASRVLREALDTDVFELRFMSGFEDVTNAVLELKPALMLFDISHGEKPFEKLFKELMNFGGTRYIRKVILALPEWTRM